MHRAKCIVGLLSLSIFFVSFLIYLCLLINIEVAVPSWLETVMILFLAFVLVDVKWGGDVVGCLCRMDKYQKTRKILLAICVLIQICNIYLKPYEKGLPSKQLIIGFVIFVSYVSSNVYLFGKKRGGFLGFKLFEGQQ